MTTMIIENFLPRGILNAVAATWPADNWPHWHKYDSRESRKLASRDAHRLPDAARAALGKMAELDVAGGDLASADAFVDFDLHGAGLHAILTGGHLALHLDGAVHPLTGWRRECNAVLFVDDWEPGWGGQLEFWANPNSGPVTVIEPRKNRLVLFASGETAWHKVAQVTGPHPRRTLSLFWWSLAPCDSNRDRADFAP